MMLRHLLAGRATSATAFSSRVLARPVLLSAQTHFSSVSRAQSIAEAAVDSGSGSLKNVPPPVLRMYRQTARDMNIRPPRMPSKTLSIGRVAKPTKQKKLFRFRALVACGNRKGVVGLGIGKGATVPEALRRALDKASKSRVPMDVVDPAGCIYHDVVGKFNNTFVRLYANRPGSGIIAGPVVRGICEVAGIYNVSSKIIGNRNRYSVAYATLDALSKIESPYVLATRTGRRVHAPVRASMHPSKYTSY